MSDKTTASVDKAVAHPSHYNFGKIEVVEFIEDQKLDFHCGNAVKYVCRAGRKDPAKEVQDLQKAVWYLQRKIEVLSPNPRRPNDMNPRPLGSIACEHRELMTFDTGQLARCTSCGIAVMEEDLS